MNLTVGPIDRMNIKSCLGSCRHGGLKQIIGHSEQLNFRQLCKNKFIHFIDSFYHFTEDNTAAV